MTDQQDWPQEQSASIPPRFRHGPYGTEAHIRIEDADDKALTAFFRGCLLGSLLTGFMAWGIIAWVGM
jgi:hypothetical protein